MAQYRVRPGFYFGGVDQYGPGTIIALTDAEAKGFSDKLERLPDAPTETGDAPTGEQQPDEDGEPAKGGKKRSSKG